MKFRGPKRFKDGRDVIDDAGSGHLKTTMRDVNVSSVEDAISSDRQLSVRKIATEI